VEEAFIRLGFKTILYYIFSFKMVDAALGL
jgi:hypothetical protein